MQLSNGNLRGDDVSQKNGRKDGKSQLVKLSPHHHARWNHFQRFAASFNKSYSGKTEALKRFHIFRKNVAAIKQMRKFERGTATYRINQFADMTFAEFREQILTPDWVDVGYPDNFAEIPTAAEMPDNFDWRAKGVVTKVKNQGSCGSCWAFSVTGNIEGQWALKKKKLVSLSEQELLDCDKLDDGCDGGLPANAYREIMRLGGLEPETDYPYDAKRETCSIIRRDVQVYINDSVKISSNESEMAAWLFKNGPISIGINANMMMFYSGGISHPWKWFCNPKKLNHGVLIVGYGIKGDKPYWIIKNSWGPGWGEQGYYYLFRGDGVCGVNQMPTSAVVD